MKLGILFGFSTHASPSLCPSVPPYLLYYASESLEALRQKCTFFGLTPYFQILTSVHLGPAKGLQVILISCMGTTP